LPPAIEPIVAHLDDLACLGVDYASVNGLVFLHSSLIGVGPRLGRLREEFREAGLWERAVLLPRMIGEAFGSEAIGVDIESDAGTTSVRTRSVAVANNPLSGETISHRRLTVAAGSLAVYASAHKGAFASLRLLASLGTGRLPRDPETLSARCREVTIGSGRDELLVSNDGEVSEMRAPLAYRVHPRGLRVLVPTAFIGGRVR
jgi:diacylglycerol kinase family enzyme